MSDLAIALESLAELLEAPRKANPLRTTLHVVAFANFTKRGRPSEPVEVAVGDDLYLQRMEDPGAGFVSRNTAGRSYAYALESLAAGASGLIKVGLYEKLWVTDGNPCEICDENALAGWIPADEDFPSGDEEPDAHPNCRCSLDTRRGE